MKLWLSDGALRCATLITWVLWRPLDATGVGLGASGSFSVGRCSLEMVQLEKRDGVNKLCTSLAQLYAQLGESEKGEKRWIATARGEETQWTKEERSLRGQVDKLQHQLEEAKGAYAQNEKLELSVEELHELYGRQRTQSTHDSEESTQLKQRLAKLQSSTSRELKQAQEAEKQFAKVSKANAVMHNEVNQETKLLKTLQHREDLEIAEIKKDRESLSVEKLHDTQLQKMVGQYESEMRKLKHQLYDLAQDHQRLTAENAVLRQSIGTAQEQAQATADLQQQVKSLSSDLQKSSQDVQSCQAEVGAAQSNLNKALKKSALACEKRVAESLQECASKV